MGTFEVFDHTADLGLAVRGGSLADLLETAARAAFSLMLEDRPEEVVISREVRVETPPGAPCLADGGPDAAELLVNWLRELLYLFETKRWVPLEFTFYEAHPAAARARVGFGLFDPERHRAATEIKAVTYHELQVRRDGEAWTARLILDV